MYLNYLGIPKKIIQKTKTFKKKSRINSLQSLSRPCRTNCTFVRVWRPAIPACRGNSANQTQNWTFVMCFLTVRDINLSPCLWTVFCDSTLKGHRSLRCAVLFAVTNYNHHPYSFIISRKHLSPSISSAGVEHDCSISSHITLMLCSSDRDTTSCLSTLKIPLNGLRTGC